MIMLRNLILLLAVLMTTACSQEKVIQEDGSVGVTGKSNGGDNITIDKAMIEDKIRSIKPLVYQLFEGLRDQAKAETLVPGSTDLRETPELVEVLLRMTHFGVGNPKQKVFDDILSDDNIVIQDKPCLDYTGEDHFAATNLSEIGGEICFSVDKISQGFPTDSEKSFDIQILALSAHEFLHHFYDSGSTEQDESIASLLQRFVVYQLHKYSEFDEDIIATNSNGYLQRFVVESKRILDRSTQAHPLSVDELDQSLATGVKQ